MNLSSIMTALPAYCLIAKEMVKLHCPEFTTGGLYQCPHCGELNTDKKLKDHMVSIMLLKEALGYRSEPA